MHLEIQRLKLNKKTIGFVPTMGALHEGHLSLIRKAHKETDVVVVSIFVNPTQFTQGEDFTSYPRRLKDDTLKCKKEKVDYIFCPYAKKVYPKDFHTYVNVEGLSDLLCGRYRKGHFKGMATIVLKLLNIVVPDKAYFGLKDYQQFIIVKQMVKDLNLDIDIIGMPIIRENDGLAMSSRNKYLFKEKREESLLLHQALLNAKKIIKQGEKNTNKIKKVIYKKLLSGRFIKKRDIDYIAVVDKDNLTDLKEIKRSCVIAIAVKVGKARLIDNIVI